MKKNYILLAFAFLLSTTTFAQDLAQGCDGSRYIDDVFTSTEMTASVQYGENIDGAGNERMLMMDIFEPSGDTQEQRPLIILAHGGSFIFGGRADMHTFCEYFAQKGYVAATIDYRYWQFAQGFPDSLGILDVVVKSVHDMRGAVRFMRNDAMNGDNTYRIDPNQIFVGGLSAGGIMACQTGMMDVDDTIPPFILDIIEDNGGMEGNSGTPDISSEVQGVVNMSGGLYQVDWMDANDPPILSMHGTNDGTVPYNFGIANDIMSINGSGNVHPQADAVGVANYLVSVPDGGHTDIYTAEQYVASQDEWNTVGMAFLETILCGLTNTHDADLSATAIKIAPNPAPETAIISVLNTTESYDVQVFDQLGRLVFTAFDNTNTTFELSKSAIGTGLFFVQIRLENGARPVSQSVVFE